MNTKLRNPRVTSAGPRTRVGRTLRTKFALVAALSTLIAGGFAIAGSANPAYAAGLLTKVQLQALGLTVGTLDNGLLYAEGPAAAVALICPDDIEVGAVCVYTGSGSDGNGTGTGEYIEQGDNNSECTDPTIEVRNFNDETNENYLLGDGPCSDKGPVVANEIAGTDTNDAGADWY